MWNIWKWLKPAPRRSTPPTYYKKLRFEHLESRDCPSAASISSLMITPQQGTTVTLSGYVMDEQPSTVQLQFSGVVSGQATANASGYFQLVQQASGLGTITAVAHDNEGLTSSPYSAQLTSNVPAITNLSVMPTNNGKMVTITGTVMDESPGNRPVTLSGVVSGTVTTNSSGSFSATLEASSLGNVTATVTDVWGQVSTAAMSTLTSAKPAIGGMNIMESGNGQMVSISGNVSDEAPAGLVVTFSGVISGTLTTGSNGAFSGSFQANGLGTVQASVTDVWGQTSAPASVTLTSSPPTINVGGEQAGGGQYVTLSGMITDLSPSGRTVTFGGVVSGTATTNSQGYYSVTLWASQLGQITATTTDVWGQVSNVAQFNLTNMPPVVSSFSAMEGQNEYWTFQGMVTDERCYGLTVTFGGLLSGLTTTVGSSGSFSIARQIAVGTVGTVTAQVADWWGQTSGTAQVFVDNTV
ncbi:MAG: hypothetical protein AB7O62_06830 [Pirellulales bacterium]